MPKIGDAQKLGKYEVAVLEERRGYVQVEVTEEDLEGADDLGDAILNAIDSGCYDRDFEWTRESLEIETIEPAKVAAK